jgi:hypothetical protein
MKTATFIQLIELTVSSPMAGHQIHLTVAGRRTMREILRASAARFHALDQSGGLDHLQIRREGSEKPFNLDHPVIETINPGDRLIVETIPAAIAAPSSISTSTGTPTDAPETDRFTSAASEAARTALSPDSATFLQRVRQVSGE